ncbi:DnaJ-like protein xdj1 [Dimargaris cristalligena]|uniref:DnaJ domain-containing protein n=1 Tax=Dimargaris cristalligena TaxID=215637 RepID=A0A4P9ZXM5_9FUNG|nr:DnaJ-like protein xdj1 [Dimargaris cristalligena]RKP38413.1 DnaJ domain-containing protein [Dimargaris cristalligena]|eukprot:RKP38413.1 DnaJ domain-containing protein [Dimargaris cristalligena]
MTTSYYTHYDYLDIDSVASKDEIKQAYQTKVLKVHPDKVRSNNVVTQRQTAELFGKIQLAWQVLRDPVKRKDYDLYLAGPGNVHSENAS